MTLEIITLLMIVAGTVIIGFTYLNLKKESAKNVSKQMDINEAGFEEYHIELNETALDIYKELDNKYQELLVIYELIEKKYSEVKTKSNFANDFNKSVNESFSVNSDYVNEDIFQTKSSLPHKTKTQSKNGGRTQKSSQNLSVFTGANKELDLGVDEDNLAVKLLDERLKEEKANNKQKKHSDVIELLNKGYNVEQIARELNIGTGEVLFVKELLKVKNEQK